MASKAKRGCEVEKNEVKFDGLHKERGRQKHRCFSSERNSKMDSISYKRSILNDIVF